MGWYHTEILTDRNNNFHRQLRSSEESPCPRECPFLSEVGVERIEDDDNQYHPSRMTRLLMSLVGRRLEEPDVEYLTTQRCKFTAFIKKYPMDLLVDEIDALYPNGIPPQELGCPAGIMVQIKDGEFHVAIGDIQLPRLPIARE